MKKSSYEGRQKGVRGLKTPEVEVWRNQYADREYTITVDIPEFTCVCPKTGLPDFAQLRIEYAPAKWCIELKSLKMYMLFYRDVGIFHEHAVNKILEDLVRATQPRRMKLTGVFNPRGGMTTTVSREYSL